MTDEPTHRERAHQLLENPASIHSVIDHYGRGSRAYSKLTDACDDLSKEQFLQLQHLFINADYDDNARVCRWIESGLKRRMKNSLLDTTEEHSLDTLAEVAERLRTYEEMGVDPPSLTVAIETTIEVLADDGWSDAKRVCSNLLDDIPETGVKPNDNVSQIVSLIAGINAALTIRSADTKGEARDAAEDFVERSDAPTPQECLSEIQFAATDESVLRDSESSVGNDTSANTDPASATLTEIVNEWDADELVGVLPAGHTSASPEGTIRTERTGPLLDLGEVVIDGERVTTDLLMEVGDAMPYEAATKARLYHAALGLAGSHMPAFTHYLYLQARRIVERQRHGSEKPSRAMLLVAELYFEAVCDLTDWFPYTLTDEQITWTDSYYHVVRGIRFGSGWLESHRENNPDHGFRRAASEYAHAAEESLSISTIRSVKYRSKAFRYAVKSQADSEAAGIHQAALDWFVNFLSEHDSVDRRLLGVSQARMRYHLYQKLKRDVADSFNDGDFDEVVSRYYDALELHQSINIRTDLSDAERRYYVALGRQAEREGDWDAARIAFNQVDIAHKDPIQNRIRLTEVKEALANNEFEKAVEKSSKLSGDNSLIDAGVQLLAEASVDDGSVRRLEKDVDEGGVMIADGGVGALMESYPALPTEQRAMLRADDDTVRSVYRNRHMTEDERKGIVGVVGFPVAPVAGMRFRDVHQLGRCIHAVKETDGMEQIAHLKSLRSVLFRL